MSSSWSHVATGLAGALLAGCGHVGVEMVDSGTAVIEDAGLPTQPIDHADAGSRDGGQTSSSDGQVKLDASADAGAAGDRDDAGPRDAATSDGSAGDAAMAPARCDLSGTWAGKVAVNVTWAGGAAAAGADTVNLWVRYGASQSGQIISGTLVLCGFTLPDFQLAPAAGNETYGQSFNAAALFDPIPFRVVAPDTTFTVAGNGAAGATFTLASTSFVLGSTSSASGIVWPPAQNVDTDQDGKPSVSVYFLNDGTHVYPPTNVTGTQRIDEAYFAIRTTFDASGIVNTCNEVSGPARVTDFDMPLSGCHIAGGAACNGTQRAFIDTLRPTYTPGSATWRAFKVLPTATCAFIRGAL